MQEPCALDGNLLYMLDGLGDRERRERGKLGWIRFLGARDAKAIRLLRVIPNILSQQWRKSHSPRIKNMEDAAQHVKILFCNG
jgi:hypothetical protein